MRARVSGARWQVHREVAPILQFLVDTIEGRGYLFDHGPRDVDDDWGFNNRPIGGTRVPSDHSWGLAVDIDAQNYPWGTRRSPPRWIIDLFAMYGWEWGGDYSKPDPMHFSFVGSVSEARHLVAMLAAGHIGNRPAPIPRSTPAKSPRPVPVTEPPKGVDAMNMVRCDIKGSPAYGYVFVITPNMERIHVRTREERERYDRWVRWWGGRYDAVADLGDWLFLMNQTRPREPKDDVKFG